MRHAQDGVGRSGDKWLVALASGIALSGLLFTETRQSYLAQNDSIRATVTVGLLGIFLALVVGTRSRITSVAVLLSAPILYMTLVALMRADGSEWVGSATRWALYLLAFVYFAQQGDVKRLRVFLEASTAAHSAALLYAVLAGDFLEINGGTRYGGSVGSPVGLATTFFVLMIGHAFVGKVMARRLRTMGWLVLCLVGIFATGSRSVALFATVLFVFTIWVLYKSAIARIVTMISLIVWGPLIWRLTSTGTDVGRRMEGLDDPLRDSSLANRVFILDTVDSRLEGYDAWVGVGLGRFPTWFESETGVSDMAPHLEFVWLLVEGGRIGALLWVVVAAILIWRVGTLPTSIPHARTFKLAFAVCLMTPQVVLQFANPAFFFQAFVPLYVIMGFVAGRLESDASDGVAGIRSSVGGKV